jgi:hypothetical protein
MAATGFYFLRQPVKNYFRHLLTQYLRNSEILKLTIAPMLASAIVLKISPELILSNSMMKIPPAVPDFVWPVKFASFIKLLVFHFDR